MDGGAGVSAKPVYNLFVDTAKRIGASYISMIMPAKWYSDGKGLGTFRETMLNDKHIAKLVDYTDSRDCFETVDIAGGICYFLRDKNYSGDCKFVSKHRGNTQTSIRNLSSEDSFIRHIEGVDIVEKIKAISNEFYNTKVSSRKPFGLPTNTQPLTMGDIRLKYNKGWGDYDSSLITVGREMIPLWKITISYLTAEHAGQTDKNGRKKILSSLDILKPNEICTETYLVVDVLRTQEEAMHLYCYLQTKLVRFLILQLATTQHLSKEKFAFVPIQDFTSSSDIDWDKSVEDIDKQLYCKYKLTENEIGFIEKMIKPME